MLTLHVDTLCNFHHEDFICHFTWKLFHLQCVQLVTKNTDTEGIKKSATICSRQLLGCSMCVYVFVSILLISFFTVWSVLYKIPYPTISMQSSKMSPSVAASLRTVISCKFCECVGNGRIDFSPNEAHWS